MAKRGMSLSRTHNHPAIRRASFRGGSSDTSSSGRRQVHVARLGTLQSVSPGGRRDALSVDQSRETRRHTFAPTTSEPAQDLLHRRNPCNDGGDADSCRSSESLRNLCFLPVISTCETGIALVGGRYDLSCCVSERWFTTVEVWGSSPHAPTILSKT
jgi:hypothetical protein